MKEITGNLLEGEVYVKPEGKKHAEIRILDYALSNNLTLDSIAASRPVCDECAEMLNHYGVNHEL
ncbi:MAG: hypothetical protein K6G68_00615 [Oscillospiraceae bacterium]|nr:hypothetical protein [Oscillospiraceae bacterium]